MDQTRIILNSKPRDDCIHQRNLRVHDVRKEISSLKRPKRNQDGGARNERVDNIEKIPSWTEEATNRKMKNNAARSRSFKQEQIMKRNNRVIKSRRNEYSNEQRTNKSSSNADYRGHTRSTNNEDVVLRTGEEAVSAVKRSVKPISANRSAWREESGGGNRPVEDRRGKVVITRQTRRLKIITQPRDLANRETVESELRIGNRSTVKTPDGCLIRYGAADDLQDETNRTTAMRRSETGRSSVSETVKKKTRRDSDATGVGRL